MDASFVTRDTPSGCIIGLLAIFCCSFVIFGTWGMYQWFELPDNSRQYNTYFWTMLGFITIGSILVFTLSVLAWRSLCEMSSRS